MKFKTIIIFILIYTKIFSQYENIESIPTKIVKDSSKIILLGENHRTKFNNKMYIEYLKILELNKIDTIFIECSYSNYIIAKIENDLNDLAYGNLFENKNFVIIPVDIETDLISSLDAINLIFYENDIFDEIYINEYKQLKNQYLKTKKYDRVIIKSLIEKINQKFIPRIKNYKYELKVLMERIGLSYTYFYNNELNSIKNTTIRDSLIFSIMNSNIKSNKIEHWGGIFGSFHLSKIEDNMFDDEAEVSSNLYSFLLKEKLVDKKTLRIITDNCKSFKQTDGIKSQFIYDFSSKVKGLPNDKIFWFIKENTYFIIFPR